MGTLKLRGRVWWIRYCRNGQRFEESSRSHRKTDAQTLLKLRQGDSAKGIPVTPAMSRLTFDDAIKDLENDYKIKGNRSLPDVQRRITLHLKPFFGGRRMGDITTADVRTYIAQRQEAKASAGSINRELAALKRAFNLAVQAGRLLHKPHVPMMKESNVRTGFFEREQYESVRKRLPEEIQPVVTFCYHTGWRRSEVLNLEWRHVDFAAGTVRLDPGTTKNDEGRVFPFGALPELKTMVEDQRAYTERVQAERDKIVRLVFHRSGKAIADFRDVWEAACKGAGYPGRLLHDFRRTAVRNLVRAGVSEKVAMTLTGHKTRSVFDRYDIVNDADLREAVRKLTAGPGTGAAVKSGEHR